MDNMKLVLKAFDWYGHTVYSELIFLFSICLSCRRSHRPLSSLQQRPSSPGGHSSPRGRRTGGPQLDQTRGHTDGGYLGPLARVCVRWLPEKREPYTGWGFFGNYFLDRLDIFYGYGSYGLIEYSRTVLLKIVLLNMLLLNFSLNLTK